MRLAWEYEPGINFGLAENEYGRVIAWLCLCCLTANGKGLRDQGLEYEIEDFVIAILGGQVPIHEWYPLCGVCRKWYILETYLYFYSKVLPYVFGLGIRYEKVSILANYWQ